MIYKPILFVICLSFCGCGDVILGSDPPNSPEANFEHLWRDYDQYYALFDVKGVNWQVLYDQYRPQVTAQTNDRELFAILSAMLTPLNDGHVSLTAPFERFQSNQTSRVPDGFNTNRVRMHYLENRGYQTEGNRFLYGRLEGDIGYIYIRSFSGGGLTGNAANWVYDIDIVLGELKDVAGMVLDVRRNSGGNAMNAYEIAGRFVDYEQPVVQAQIRNGPKHTDFTDPETWSMRPRGETQYIRPTVVLVNNFSVSAAELFVLALRRYSHITVMGSTTPGALSANIYRELPNGWIYRISTVRTRSPEGDSLDLGGLPPDIYVPFEPISEETIRDPVLDAAMALLKEQ